MVLKYLHASTFQSLDLVPQYIIWLGEIFLEAYAAGPFLSISQY